MKPTLRARPGFSLGLAMFALVLLGALAAGILFATSQQYKLGANTLTQSRALSAAEFGQYSAYSGWDRAWNMLPTGSTVTRNYASGDGSMSTVRVTKLNQNVFYLDAVGTAGSGGDWDARRRTGLLVRLFVPSFTAPGALTTRGLVRIGGSTTLIGRDTSFAGWDCPAAGGAVAGAAVPSLSNLTLGGTCSGFTCLQGSPLVAITPIAADTNTYFDYGDTDWNEMVAAADKQVVGTLTGVNPVLNGTTCDYARTTNWGDSRRLSPRGACESYFPVVYAPGDLTINGTQGQGILLVNGNLNIQGGFEFYGQVIVRGAMKLTGTGNKLNGSVMAASIIDSTAITTASGNSTIRYSRCAINAAARSSATPTPVLQRAWSERF